MDGLMQVCLSLAASLLLKGQAVHWVDMTDGFSATRLHQILQDRMKGKVRDHKQCWKRELVHLFELAPNVSTDAGYHT